MEWSKWRRDASKVHAALVTGPNGSVTTTKALRIFVPERFVDKELTVISAETYILGVCAFVVEDKYYGVSSAATMLRIEPTAISTVRFDGDSYLEFSFDPGAVVIADTNTLKENSLGYAIYNEFVAKGRVPWYLQYEDLAKLFYSVDYYAGLRLSSSHAILEMFAAAISRDAQQRTTYYRHTVKAQDDAVTRPPAFIPLRSVTYGATNTTAKLLGSYWDDGLTSALVNPSDKVERIEELLRR